MARPTNCVPIFAGRAGDRNPRAMQGAVELGSAIARSFGLNVATIVAPQGLATGGWASQLESARPGLVALAARLDGRLAAGEKSLLATSRCAASLATLPVVARRCPDAAVVWLDAHADCNTPADKADAEDAYLGGMVLSGASGEWRSGLGDDLRLEQVILVGGRDLDAPEITKIRDGRLRHVEVGEAIGRRVAEAIGARPVYIHLDCDVLSAGLLPTEYQVDGGLDFEALREALDALSACDVVGLEIAEYEGAWPDGRAGDLESLLRAVTPLVRSLCWS